MSTPTEKPIEYYEGLLQSAIENGLAMARHEFRELIAMVRARDAVIDDVAAIINPGCVERAYGRDLVLWAQRCEDERLAYAKQIELLNGKALPIDMILYCPNCGVQHIDAPEVVETDGGNTVTSDRAWANPLHRSHFCRGCGCIWRFADVATNGVADIKTEGKADTWVSHPEEVEAATPVGAISPNTQQILHALRRCIRDLEAQADALHAQHDYAAEFPANDAERLKEAVAILSGNPINDDEPQPLEWVQYDPDDECLF